MKFTATLAVLASDILSVVSAQDGTYTNLSGCANAPSPFCLTASGTLSAPITQGAQYSVKRKFLGHSAIDDRHDLCTLLSANGTPCPIAAGAFNMKICINALPNLPHSLPLDYQFSATTGDSELIFCQATPHFPGVKHHPVSGIVAVNCP
ncbi:MAG: hypothetical protein J3R72DRAFT_423523 [Linnemannia gamsii]|nr:MAG: hypothetical protein J3R72DRAFT_423523 [Linnemannia gamsii]